MAITNLFRFGQINQLHNAYPRFFTYLLIGGSAAAVDLLVFVVLFNLFEFSAVASNVLSVSLATVESFTLNACYNFKRKDRVLFRFSSFVFVSFLGLALGSYLIYLLHDVLGINGNLAKIAIMPLVVVVQFLWNKRITFRK